ncbi:gluconolactonase [Burkholderiaceae bacterium 26]|nr:gluconolactonase [Burkholderiaceae bacterium 26]
MVTSVERVGDMLCTVGESPVWHTEENALYWTDIPARMLWRWDAERGATSWPLPEMAGCIARTADDGWVLAMESGIFRVVHPEVGQSLAPLHKLVHVDHGRDDMRFNDGRCDRQGRFLAGTMVLDMGLAATNGRLYGLDNADAELSCVLDDLIVPNGLAFSPDGWTMYLSDSHPDRQAIWAFDYDIDSGTPHEGRLFVDMHAYPGRPDGAAVDVDGCYWICANDGGQVLRFTPEGKLDKSIALPVQKPAMCAFGGPNLDTLFITSIRPGNVTDDLAGAMFAVPSVGQGIAETPFGKA